MDLVRPQKTEMQIYRALFTGMRRSELLALRWQDVDFIFSQVYVNRSLHQLRDGSFIFTKSKCTKIVQERLGHGNIAITIDTYSHVKPGFQEIAAQRFDDALKVRHNI